MEEKDIRPQKLLDDNTALLMFDIRNILRYLDDFVSVGCPACDGMDAVYAFEKYGFTFVECGKCKTLFTNPRPTEKHLAEYYAQSKCYKHYNDVIFPQTEKERSQKIFAPRAKKIVDMCRQYATSAGSMVDIGAGFGTFCDEIRKLSYFERIIAVEPCHALAANCRARGFEVYESMVEDLSLDNIDVVTCFELVEHLFSPHKFIVACSRLLPTGGFLFLTTPNVKGFDMVILREENDNIIAPNHINIFNPRSITSLLTKCGFEIVELETPGELDVELVWKKYISKQVDISEHAFLKDIFMQDNIASRKSFQNFLSKNLLSSHMMVLARKM